MTELERVDQIAGAYLGGDAARVDLTNEILEYGKAQALAAIANERQRCAYIVATKFEEARDTEFDLGFETARKVFAAAILNPNN